MVDLTGLPLSQLSELASVALAQALASAWQPLGPYTASGQIVNGKGRLCGLTLKATTATIAQVRLWDVESNGGRIIADLDVSQGFSVMGGPSEPGVAFMSGLYLEVLAGAPSLCVWLHRHD